MNICIPVRERREQESDVRRFYDPVLNQVFDNVCIRVIVESRFGQLHGTDAAEQKFIDIVGCVVHLKIVGPFGGDVIGAVNQYDIVVFRVYVVLDNFLVKFFDQGVIFQL